MIRYPAPLAAGSRIALTAVSDGVRESAHARLDLVIRQMQQRGFEIVEGACLRASAGHVSAPARERAAEFMRFALDDTIAAIAPPWGGELAMEMLPLLDYDALARARPKWVFGFSDVSTLTAKLTARCGWATVHSANLMDLVDSQTDPLTVRTLDWLARPAGARFSQDASSHFQKGFPAIETDPHAALEPTHPTRWQYLPTAAPDGNGTISIEGRLLGGCLDTLAHLLGQDGIDPAGFARTHGDLPCLLYLENVELTPTQLARTLMGLKHRGVFRDIAGLLMGRNAGPAKDHAGFSDLDALNTALADAPFPVLFDLDIGHRPPNLTLINGARARVWLEGTTGGVEQVLD